MINCTFVREIYHNIKHIVAYLDFFQIRVGNLSTSDVELGWKTPQERMHAGLVSLF